MYIDYVRAAARHLVNQFGLALPPYQIEVQHYGLDAAAMVDLNTRVITVFEQYHRRFPGDLNITLLHEFGHLSCGPGHNTDFYRYFLYLREQQERYALERRMVPQNYLLFRFARPLVSWIERWVCIVCRNAHYYQQAVKASVCRCGAGRFRDDSYLPMARGWEHWPSSYLEELFA